MRRTFGLGSIVLVMLMSLLGGPVTAAQEDETTAGDGFVGAWQFTDVVLGLPSIGTFTADGNLIISNLPVEPLYEGADFDILLLSASHGVWESTGDNTADFTFMYLYVNDRGEFESSTTISGTLELSADGQTLTGEFAFQVSQPDGTVVHADRGAIEGTRISIIPMEELAPAATPAT